VILAVDTCGPRPRVALRVDGHVTTATPEQLEARADDAASLADHLLRAAGSAAAELTGIGVTIGPGSYTGVRIGLALVRGLSLVDRVPVVGVGTLELLAASAPEDRVCAVLDAGADKVYVAVFQRTAGSLSEVVTPRVVSRSDLADFLHGEAGGAAVAAIAASRLQRGEGASADLVLPLYVGSTGARPNRNKVATPIVSDE
jgi:tRNA threonylcarbamoyladenosine biosynthesis protein TsaB